jgi:GNAT superfamily N-acetyltransferase
VGEVVVRQAVEDEAGTISGVLRSAFAEYESLYTREAYRATTPDTEAVIERMRRGPIWVAVLGEDIIGTVAAVCENGECFVRGMGVVPDSRGRGAGALLLEAVESHAIRQAARLMYLNTTPFLYGAIRLYERFGFERSAEGPLDLFGTPIFTMTKTTILSSVLTARPDLG